MLNFSIISPIEKKGNVSEKKKRILKGEKMCEMLEKTLALLER